MPSNINKSRRDKTTVQIEEVDESWALMLLNESEKEDYPIKVENERDFYSKELSLIKPTKMKNSDDEYIKVKEKQQTESPSAIENQLQAKAKKQQNKHTEIRTRKQWKDASFSRIKSFFVA